MLEEKQLGKVENIFLLLFIGFVEEIRKTLEILIESLISTLEEANSLPNYFLNVGLALLGILIPLAIAILTEVYRKKGTLDEEFAELDLLVILDDVFGIKRLLICSLLIFLPYVVWDISSGLIRLFEIIISIIGISLIIKTIYNVYCWTKGDVYKYRFSYLKKELKNPSDLETAWRSVWKSKKISPQTEREFFKIFSSVIENNMKTEKRDLMVIIRLLNSFLNFIKERSILFLVAFDEVFPKILDWNFIAWKREYEHLGQKEVEEISIWANWFEISRILNSIIKSVEERAIEDRQAYLLFKHIQGHIKTHVDETIQVKDHKRYYIVDLLGVFYKVLFEKAASLSEYSDFWDNFPKEWKITEANIENEENFVVRVSLNEFLDWARRRIMEAKEDCDRQLEIVSFNLFPEVDPSAWATILIFVLLPFGENRVKSVIERRWTFGYLTRGRFFWGNISEEEIRRMIEQQELSEIKNTYKLTSLLCRIDPLFYNAFSKENLEKYIEEANKLKYADDSSEEHKRLKLIKHLQGLLNSIE